MHKSFENINYTIRPGKQTERKLMVEILQRLNKVGIHINDYVYTGFGSVYYVDFILFHKLLHIDSMMCVERANIPDRMKFNCPYDFINIFMDDFSGYVSKINYENNNLIWLDLDGILKKEFLDDLGILFSKASKKTIFFLTIKCDPDSYYPSSNHNFKKDKMYFEEFSKYIKLNFSKYSGKVDIKDLTANNFPKLLVKILNNKFESALSSRPSLKFFQVCNFIYSDSSSMLTLGGIVDEKDRQNEYDESGIYSIDFITKDGNPIEISVPPLTIKEKHWLDKRISSLKNGEITNDDLEFELKGDLLKNYIKYYKHYPSYHEIVM